MPYWLSPGRPVQLIFAQSSIRSFICSRQGDYDAWSRGGRDMGTDHSGFGPVAGHSKNGPMDENPALLETTHASNRGLGALEPRPLE
jgi:hypothetical protein